MTSTDREGELKNAELRKIHAEIARLQSDRDKIELEKGELVVRSKQKWWNIRASGLIQAVIGGIVAGALVAGFGLDHFLKISDLNAKSQKALQVEKQQLINRTKVLEARANLLETQQEDSRQVIISLRNENNKIKAKTEATLKNLLALSVSSSQSNEDLLNSEVASLRAELKRVKAETESREQNLNKELQNLAQEQVQTPQGTKDNWFPVIASPYNEVDLRGKLEELGRSSLSYPVHVYKTADKRGAPVYAITFEGYLSKSEANKRITYAIKTGVAKDAYPWSSNIWGVNIVDKFVNN